MSTAISQQTRRRIHKAVCHLLADLLEEFDEPIPGPTAADEISTALEYTDAIPADDTTTLPKLYTVLRDDGFPDVWVTFADGTDGTFNQAAEHGYEIADVTLPGARPSGLPAHGEIVTGDESATKATADFTELANIGEDKADILADAGHQTWQDIAQISQDELADIQMIGDATAKDLKAEANARADTTTQLAHRALERVTAIDTDDDGRGISYNLDVVAEPPGDPQTPVEANHYHGWPILEDIGHRNVPDDPGPVKTQALPNGTDELEELCGLLAKRRNVMLIGPPGTGKNIRIKKAFHETNRPLVTIPMDNDTMVQELMGNFTVTDDGTVEFQDAALPMIVKNGGGICFDEPNAAPQSVLRGLYKILEDDAQLFVKGKNEIIEPHPEFYALATINPADLGAGPLPRSFARRFQKLPIDTLPASQEADLLDERVNRDRTIVSKDQLEDLVSVANNIREQAREGQSVPYITTGELENVCHAADGADGTPDSTALQGALKMEVQGAQLSSVGGNQMGTILDDDALDDLMTAL